MAHTKMKSTYKGTFVPLSPVVLHRGDSKFLVGEFCLKCDRDQSSVLSFLGGYCSIFKEIWQKQAEIKQKTPEQTRPWLKSLV